MHSGEPASLHGSLFAITGDYAIIRILYVYLFIQHNQIIKEADTFVSAHSDLVTPQVAFFYVRKKFFTILALST